MIFQEAAAATASAPIAPRDRLWFGLFLALAAHATLILGISSKPMVPQPQLALSVSLAASADGVPQEQQTLQNSVRESRSIPVKPVKDFKLTEKAAAITSPSTSNNQEAELPNRFDRNQLIAAIANTGATDEMSSSADRVRRLDETPVTPQTKNAENAYLAMWRRKCERLGRLNYPQGNVQGELVMQVSIFSSGHLDYVRIVRSSGSSLLDQAALDTVTQAAPYQPFSTEMRKAYDRLEFSRTWQYSKFGADINR